MPAVNVNIQPEIIRWALSQTQKEKLGDTLMNNIIQWLNGTKTPTFKQIEDFSKKATLWYVLCLLCRTCPTTLQDPPEGSDDHC